MATKTTQQQALEQSELWKLYEAISGELEDMRSLSRLASFMEIAGVIKSLEARLNMAREANAEFIRNCLVHEVVA